MPKLSLTALCSLVLCTDTKSIKAIARDDIARARDLFLDGIDRYFFDGSLGFATVHGQPTHQRWLATATCLAAPAIPPPPDTDTLKARNLLNELHHILYGSIADCRSCKHAATDKNHFAHAAANLMRAWNKTTCTPHREPDADTAIASLHLLLRAQGLKTSPTE